MMHRESGSLLIEMIIALSVLTVGILGFFSSFLSNARASGGIGQQDEVRVAIENVVEFLRNSQFDTVYQSYNNRYLEVPTLEGHTLGTSATAQVQFYVNETTLPMEFGPVLDIDGSGGLGTADCSTSYRLLPTQITLRYRTNEGPATKDLFLVLGEY